MAAALLAGPCIWHLPSRRRSPSFPWPPSRTDHSNRIHPDGETTIEDALPKFCAVRAACNLLADAMVHGLEAGARLGQSHAGSQAREDPQPCGAVASPQIRRRTGLHGQRDPHVGRLTPRFAEESARRHTDDRESGGFEPEAAADGRAVAPEAPRPIRVTEDSRPVRRVATARQKAGTSVQPPRARPT